MSLQFKSAVSREIDVHEAVAACAATLRQAFPTDPPAAVLAYGTVLHDQEALVRALHDAFPGVPLVGCSTSGVMTQGAFCEDGYLVGVMGMGGSALRAACAQAEEIQRDTEAKARAMGESLRRALGDAPRVIVLHYDPLCHVDIERFAITLEETAGCPIIGGAAGQPWGPLVQTYQYAEGRALGQAAVALALAGDFAFEIGTTTGTSPTGLTMKVTRAEGNVLLELDGRSALEVFNEMAGTPGAERLTNDANSAVAMGIEREGAEVPSQSRSIVRGAFGVDVERRGIVLQASIEVGTLIMFHRLSRAAVFEGTQRMARALAESLRGHRIRAAIGCECTARSAPLLGPAEMLRENLVLQASLAPGAEWLGMLAFGELAPHRGRTTFFNFTYPLLLLAERDDG